MKTQVVTAFFDELSKIAGTAFSSKQYKELYGPKLILKNRKFPNPKENVPQSQYTAMSNDSTYHPISSANRVGEGRETPGGPL